MSWVAHQETTRAEDMAYCLMGIFDVNMPILYGESLHSAFRRLQEEIMKTSFDQTLFAWRQKCASSGLLAGSPKDFKNTPELGLWAPFVLSPSVTTNIGILFRACMLPEDYSAQGINDVNGVVRAALQCDVKTDQGWMILVLRLRLVKDVVCHAYGQPRRAYRRIDCDLWEAIPSRFFDGRDYTEILVLGNDNHDLIHVASKQDLARRLADAWGSQPMITSVHTGVNR